MASKRSMPCEMPHYLQTHTAMHAGTYSKAELSQMSLMQSKQSISHTLKH